MRRVGKIGSKSNVIFKCFNSNYIEFVDYDTCEKLIWISGEDRIITNKISKQGSTKIHINNISP